jgi:hypothetical protein
MRNLQGHRHPIRIFDPFLISESLRRPAFPSLAAHAPRSIAAAHYLFHHRPTFYPPRGAPEGARSQQHTAYPLAFEVQL